MSTIFRLDASIRGEGSVTRAIASTLQSAITDELGDHSIVRRDVGLKPLPSTAWAAAVSSGYIPEEARSAEQKVARARATALADELIGADAYIFAIPLYNFGVSQHVKAWIDLVITEPRFAPGAERLLAGRPAFLVIARGGGYAPGTPRDGWDHATAYYKRIFADVWGLSLEIIESELTLAEVVPAMAALREIAAENLQRAHVAAGEHGRQLADKLRVVAAV